jgi:hypothetical protein
MPIPDSILGPWSRHYSGEASKQAHVSIRNALASYKGWTKETNHDVFLQGSYKNDTNLHRDSDVDIVVQLPVRIRPRVAALSGAQLEQAAGHKLVYKRWYAFRNQTLEALRAAYGTKAVTSGRKSLKLAKSKVPAPADVVVTVRYQTGLAFYLPDERRWVTSYPQQHYEKGLKKERGTNGRYKWAIRMFKSAKNHLIENHVIKSGTASSYFIECLLYNVPNDRFNQNIDQCYHDVVEYLATVNLQQFKCQNGVQSLFGSSRDSWSVDKAQKFIQALGQLWKKWPKVA